MKEKITICGEKNQLNLYQVDLSVVASLVLKLYTNCSTRQHQDTGDGRWRNESNVGPFYAAITLAFYNKRRTRSRQNF